MGVRGCSWVSPTKTPTDTHEVWGSHFRCPWVSVGVRGCSWVFVGVRGGFSRTQPEGWVGEIRLCRNSNNFLPIRLLRKMTDFGDIGEFRRCGNPRMSCKITLELK